MKWYSMAEKNGQDGAMYEMGKHLLWESGKENRGLELLKLSAEKGNVLALNKLGEHYQSKRDLAEAFKYFERAAHMNYAPIHNNLACCFQQGFGGVQRDISKTVQHFKKAKKLNYSISIHNLALLYEMGQDNFIKKDISQAVKYYKRASKQQNTRSLNNLGSIYEKGAGGISQDLEKAFLYYLNSANLGYPRAAFNVARLYEKGSGIPLNKNEAKRYYEIAAMANHEVSATAQNHLNSLISEMLFAHHPK